MSASDHLSPQQFYHGTDADLSTGAVLRPASELYPGEKPTHHLWDRVSVTTDPEEATNYGSRVYKVDVHDSPVLDPEYARSKIGFHVSRATIRGEY